MRTKFARILVPLLALALMLTFSVTLSTGERAAAFSETDSFMPKNLLTRNTSDAEDGYSGFYYDGSANNTLSLTRDSNQKWESGYSIKLTNSFTVTQHMSLHTKVHTVKVNPGTTYVFSAYVRGPNAAKAIPFIRWVDAQGSVVASATGALQSLGNSWPRLSVSGTAPAGTAGAYVEIQYQSAAPNDAMLVDGLQLEQGSSATAWVRGGSPFLTSEPDSYDYSTYSDWYQQADEYKITKVRLRLTSRRSSLSSTSGPDRIYLYYQTCSNCGSSSYGSWTAPNDGDTVYDFWVDMSSLGATGVRTRLYTSSGYSSDVATAEILEVEYDAPPFTPTITGITTGGPFLFNATTSWLGAETSGVYEGTGERILGARWVTYSIYDYSYLEGFDTNSGTWKRLSSRSSTSRVDSWVDLRSSSSFNITKLRVVLRSHPTSGYFPYSYVPQVYYTWGSAVDLPDYKYDTTIAWNTNNNPQGTTYEVWRKTLNSAGTVLADVKLGSTTDSYFATDDQVAGAYYRYRVRAIYGGRTTPTSAESAYWTPPVPSVTENQAATYNSGSLQVNWPAVYGSPNYYLWYQQENGNWTGAYNTTSTSYNINGLNPMYRYKIGLGQYSLPNGGERVVVTDDEWYSPTFPAVDQFEQQSGTPDSTQLRWKATNSSSSWLIDSSATIRVTRDGVVVYEGRPTYSSGWGSFQDTGLVTGQTYTYLVCALNGKDVCGPTKSLTVRRLPNKPGTPSINGTAPAGNQITLSWTANQNPTGTVYELWRKTLKPDGTELDTELVVSAANLLSFSTTDQVPGAYYQYWVKPIIGGVEGQVSDAVAYWLAPMPNTATAQNVLNVSWPVVRNNPVVSTNGNLRVSANSTTWQEEYLYLGVYTSRLHYTFAGQANDKIRIRAYSPSSGYYDPLDITAGAASLDAWIDLPYPVDRIYTQISRANSGGTSTFDVPEYEGPSLTPVNLQYSENGTNWSNHATNLSVTSSSIALSPLKKYKVALIQYSLPNSGPTQRTSDGQWYSPLYPAVDQFEEQSGTGTPNSTRIRWKSTNSSNNWIIDSGAEIRITRDGDVIFKGVPSYSSGWASLEQPGLITGQTYTYEICALNGVDVCGATKTLTVRRMPNKPGKPTIGANAPSADQISLTWTANQNPTGTVYELWRKTIRPDGTALAPERITSGAGLLTFNTTDQVPGAYYEYYVRAVIGGVVGPNSDAVSYWLAPMPTTAEVENSLNVSWSAVRTGSLTPVTLQYSENGTTWTNRTTNITGTSGTIPVPSPLSPTKKYKVALTQYSLPDSGPKHTTTDGEWYSPIFRALARFEAGTVTQTKATLWWATGDYNDNAAVTRDAKIRITRDGVKVADLTNVSYTRQTRSSFNDYWASWTDPAELTPGTTYTYTICAVNALDACGATKTVSIVTVPPTPAIGKLQFGSYGWQKTPDAGGWAELSWSPSVTATSYKVYVTGTESRTITVNSGTTHRFTDLKSGGNYTFAVTAVNNTGESVQSATASAAIPHRVDNSGPTGESIQLNDSAPNTGGSRVMVRGTASDSGSGVYGIQLSNDGSTWSATFPLRDWTVDNLINAAGGNAFFTDLGGWVSDPGVWTSTPNDAGAQQGGKVAKIEWTAGAGKAGLKLDDRFPVEAGKQYTFSLRYKVTGLQGGSVSLWGNWQSSGGGNLATDSRVMNNTSTWTVVTWTDTAPPNAAYREITMGFDQAVPVANQTPTLWVDWIQVNQGPLVTSPKNSFTNPLGGSVDWTIPATSFGAKTVSARFVDALGNTSAKATASINFFLTDTSGPTVAVKVNGGAVSTDKTNVMLTLTATDDATPQSLMQMRYSLNGATYSDWQPFSPNLSVKICTLSDTSFCQGQRQIWVQVQDAAGNIGGTVGSIFYRTDTSPAAGGTAIVPSAGAEGSYDTGAGTVAVWFVRVTETTLTLDPTQFAGVNTIRYGYDPNRYGQWETFQSSKTITLPMIQGIQTLYVQTDAGAVYQVKFLLDFTPPEVTATFAGGATITKAGGQTTLVLESVDNLSRNEDLMVSVVASGATVQVKDSTGNWVSGTTFRQWQPATELQISGSGLVTLSIKIKDPAGNTRTIQKSIFVQ